MRLAFLALVAACSSSAPAGTTCNGHDELCARRYDQVAYPGTHDAYADAADNFGAPDQTYTMTRQLDDGVRVLHLEMQAYDGDVSLCHSVCQIGSQLLVDGFTEVRRFLDSHPREVVTLLMESTNVASDDVAARVHQSGLDRYTHAQAMGAPWPTLGQLIAANQRVITLLADQSGTGGTHYSWLLDRFAWSWETPWDNQTLADFAQCGADRGTMGNDLYVVDTYLEDQILTTTAHAQLVNDNPFLVDRLLHCQAVAAQLPNYVMVNYYQVGDLFAVVDVLNGFAPLPGDDLDAFPPPPPDGGI